MPSTSTILAGSLFESLRYPVLPHPRVLDQVVVDGHDLVFVLQWHYIGSLAVTFTTDHNCQKCH